MNTHADKKQENKNQSVASAVSQKQSGGKSTFQFVDNRPEAVAQRKLEKMANNSPQARQAEQLQAMADNYSAQHQNAIQKKENNTGLPDNLKSGIENLSGYSMDDVKVHYNSDKPAQLQAHAYAQGTDIHLASGQEKHLPHEAWHAVQQKQGRVKPTMQMKGKVNVNDDAGLEKEADVMGLNAMKSNPTIEFLPTTNTSTRSNIIQKKLFRTKAETEPLSEEQIIALIDRLVAQYGDSNRESITELVRSYVDDRKKRSIRDAEDFVRANVRVDATRATPMNFDDADRPMLPSGETEIPIRERGRGPNTPERRAALRHMEFNSVTFLTAKVFLTDGNTLSVELRNQEGRQNQGHAEMILLRQIGEHISRLRGVGVRQITITINNSPCVLCGPDIAKWAEENGNPRIVIHFTNPYGDKEEFVHSIQSMRRAGVHLHDFNPIDHVGTDTDDEMEQSERQGQSIKDRFSRQALSGRRELESVPVDRRPREETTQPTHVRAIAYVANMRELAARSWNKGDIVEVADTGNGSGISLQLIWMVNHHGGTEITKGDLHVRLRGG
jgi:hypothetical protein